MDQRVDGVAVARTIALIQAVITALFALAFGVFQGRWAGFSAGLGGVISLLASVVLAWIVFGRADSPQRMLRNLFLGEFVKIALTVALFIGVLIAWDLAWLPLLLTFAATLFAFWIALLRIVD